jgi:hypothetical protein
MLCVFRAAPPRSSAAQIIAYNCVAVWYAITCAYYGSLSWFSGSADAVGPEPFDRVYGRSVDYEIIGMVTAAFETYNTIAVMVIPEYRNAEFIGHHSACLLLTQIASGGPNGAFLHYYGIFFFGVGSVSSVPLALRELFTAVDLPGLAELSEVLFALAFVPIRSIYWLFVSHAFWTDTISLPIKEANSLIAFYLANLGLTGLQLLWTGKIIDGVKGKLGGGKAKKK